MIENQEITAPEDMHPVDIDASRQVRAKEYARIRRRLMLVDLALGAVYILAWIFSGLPLALRDALASLTPNAWFQVAGFAAVFGGVYFLLDLPLSYYQGFVLPHRYELSNQTFSGWVGDQFKSLIISAVLGLIVIEVVYLVLRFFPAAWWLITGGFLLLFTVVLANLAPVLLLPLFYKLVPLSEDRADLAGRLVQLAEKAGTRVKGVFKFDLSRRTKAANAALTGIGSTRRIIIGDTLLNEFTDDEIETVMAHELGHHVNKDIPTGIIIDSLLTLGGLYLASLGLRWGVDAFGYSSPADPAAMPLFLLVMGVYGLVTMPLTNAYSRWRERRADEYALSLTGKGAAYASALARLANQNLSDADPEPWVEWLLYTHPALKKRIEMARSKT